MTINKMSLNLILLVLFTVSPFFAQQMSKFEKWQQSSYFKGFCISDWNNLHETYVSQEEFNDLKASGANLVIIQTGGINSVDAPYGPGIWYTDGGTTIYWQDVLDDMVGFARNAGLQ